MSIVPLVKITIYGHQQDKEPVLSDLQEMGCLHVVPLQSAAGASGDAEGSFQSVREALKFLQHCPQQRPQARETAPYDTAVIVANRAIELQRLLQERSDERDFLRRRIADLEPWGDFTLPPLEERRSLRLWFYIVPHLRMKEVEATGRVWEVVGRDRRFAYVVVLSEEEPQDMPVARTHTGDVPLSRLQERLRDVELELDAIQMERAGLTRWIRLLARNLARMEDRATLAEVSRSTYDLAPVFALQAWAPREHAGRLRSYATEKSLALQIEDPSPEETPPTLLRNPPAFASGQDLVTFYMTPNYWYPDPSMIVFFSFILFFGMIVGDVGYGLLLGVIVALTWRRMDRSETGKRFRVLGAALVGATVGWGALVGSYFGVTPSSRTIAGAFRVFDLNDYRVMMVISIGIGAGHVMLANVVDIWRRGLSAGALAPAGWIAMLLGGLMLWSGAGPAGYGVLGAGGAAVVWFTAADRSGLRRLAQGLLGLTRITGAFGDVLSYLRLFALGLATSSLALVFNDLAMQVLAVNPGLGLLFALLILAAGHTLNFALALGSGVVHGLRLNFIEFFHWGAPEEGIPFRAFTKRLSEK